MYSIEELATDFRKLGIRAADTANAACFGASGWRSCRWSRSHTSCPQIGATSEGTLTMYASCLRYYDEVGRGPDADHTAGMPITQAGSVLAPFFVNHGYAFLYPFRRGHGLSASQAPFMQDVLRGEEEARGRGARQHLQFILLTTEQIDDVMAALVFLKTVPGIDSHQVAVAAHSFGGQLTLLAAERDKTIRAVVTFAGAAASWERSPELRELLTSAIHGTNAAIMLTHAENDYSTAPGRTLADEPRTLA